jgi:hypothetical protein
MSGVLCAVGEWFARGNASRPARLAFWSGQEGKPSGQRALFAAKVHVRVNSGDLATGGSMQHLFEIILDRG